MTVTKNAIPMHNFANVTFGGKGKTLYSINEEIEEVIFRKFGRTREARRFAKTLSERVSHHRLDRDDGTALVEASRADVADPVYGRYAASTAISILAPTVKIDQPIKYTAVNLGTDGFIIDSNINFAFVDAEYKKRPGQENGSMSGSLIAAYIFGARVDAYFASAYMSGYVCDAMSSALMRRRFLDLIRRRERDAAEMDLFQTKLLPDGRNVRDVINSGEAPFADILPVIQQGRKFKEWLGARNPDESLLKDYFDEIARRSWIEKLPVKAFRWVATGGLGIAAGAAFSPIEGALAGLGIGAVDTFLIDRLLKGWRPDQFVEGSLTNFIVGKH